MKQVFECATIMQPAQALSEIKQISECLHMPVAPV